MQIQMALASLLIIGVFAFMMDFRTSARRLGCSRASRPLGPSRPCCRAVLALCAHTAAAGSSLSLALSIAVIERGLWSGFDGRACVAVASSALGGLIVSAVLKYADSVLKGYATATSVILTGILSALFFGTSIDLHFMLAVVNVTCSIALYGNLASDGPSKSVMPTAPSPAKGGTAEAELAPPCVDSAKQHA